MNFQNANKVKNESTSSFCNCGFFRNWSNVLFLQKIMKYLAIVLLCLILGSFGLYFIKYMPSKVIVPVAPKNDSLAIVGAKFDSLQLEIGLMKKNDSVKEIIIDSLIKLKYADKKEYIYLNSTAHSALRIQLLSKLDSAKFEY